MATAFANVYYKRAVATAKPCFVCSKPTTVVLATINTVDFLYTCSMHLEDRGFATKLSDDTVSPSPSVSQDEIDRVKREWEDHQKRKAEEKKEDKDKKEGDTKDKDKEKKDPKPSASATPSPASTPAATTPKHEKYALHRDMFSMRQSEHKRRRNAAQAKELAPLIPSVPRRSLD
ncbi:DUF1742-domain-containing protein [Auriculariales sp. MPI-PUGE-AT-0066]|nr:DUF1742-domain-containing protein [Auriculariales sp. MPI-PUGE-AT-0066]